MAIFLFQTFPLEFGTIGFGQHTLLKFWWQTTGDENIFFYGIIFALSYITEHGDWSREIFGSPERQVFK